MITRDQRVAAAPERFARVLIEYDVRAHTRSDLAIVLRTHSCAISPIKSGNRSTDANVIG
jgi:hypothetical protein